MNGLKFEWNPDLDKFNSSSVVTAIGQIFFTLSLGTGIISNYSSYLQQDEDIVEASVATVSLNQFAELILAGTSIIPISYAFLGPEGIKGSIGLSFMSLPSIFNTMTCSGIFGSIWFFLLFFVGFTSSIAMYNYLVTLLEEDLGMERKKGAWIIFIVYLVVGSPIALESIITNTANLFYFKELDNWIGNYLLIALGLIEIIVVAWLVKEPALAEMNKGNLWKVPKWFFKLFHQFLTPVSIIIFLAIFTKDYAVAVNFKLIPYYMEGMEQDVIWVNLARAVIVCVLLAGFIQTYKSIKVKYISEINNKTV